LKEITFVGDVNVSKMLNTVRKTNIIHHLSTETNGMRDDDDERFAPPRAFVLAAVSF